MRNAIKLIVGSCMVYLAVVLGGACAGSIEEPHRDTGGGMSASSAEPPASSLQSSGAITDPVPSANADPVPGSRLRSVYLSGFDGSKQWVGWHDTLLGVRCAFGTMDDGSLRCLPVVYVATKGFADAACTVPIAFAAAAKCQEKPAYAGTLGTCGGFARIARVGAQLALSRWYTNSGGTCFGIDAAPETNYYALGDEVPATDFVGGIAEMQ